MKRAKHVVEVFKVTQRNRWSKYMTIVLSIVDRVKDLLIRIKKGKYFIHCKSILFNYLCMRVPIGEVKLIRAFGD